MKPLKMIGKYGSKGFRTKFGLYNIVFIFFRNCYLLVTVEKVNEIGKIDKKLK